MNLINIIVSEKGYPDRFSFLCSLDTKLDKQIIYTRSYYSSFDLKNTEIRLIKETNIMFWFAVAKDILKVLKQNPLQKWIITEHLTAFTLLFLRILTIGKAKRIVLGHGVYSEEQYNLKNRLWNKDEKPKLGFMLNLSYWFHTWKKTIRADFFASLADIVITNSITFHEYISKKKGQENVLLLRNTLKNTKQNTCFLPPVYDILYCGSIRSSKGVARLLKAIDILNNKGLSLSVNLVGGIYKEDIKWVQELMKMYSHINCKITPKVSREELTEICKSSQLFVYPSLTEGYPRVVLEVLGEGIPVLVSNIPAHIHLDCDLGILSFFDKFDTLDLVDKIEIFWNQKGLSVKPNYQPILDMHSLDLVSCELIEFYNSLKTVLR